jgi:8-oxo-dGTP pyrophosphatase MutT (NUDIX family)
MSHTDEQHLLTMSFVVEPRGATPHVLLASPRQDEDLVMAEGEVPEPHQRVAAYAFVTSRHGVLMTQFSALTNAQGRWGLPGGGIQPGEAPNRAVVREVWEESGQEIELNELAHVHTSRWIGRAPGGRLEDFHAVRVVYRASCPVPTAPLVHDAGGTTAAAAWVLPEDLEQLDVTSNWRSLLRDVVGRGDLAEFSGFVIAPDQTDRTKDDEDETNADDGTGPQP